MSMLLKNAKDLNALISAIDNCKGDVILRSCDGTETFNMKSTLSKYMALGKLLSDHGDSYEFFCMNKDDEPYLLTFFHELING